MPIYRGSAFRQYLIDRYALGFDFDTIQEDFQRTQGIAISSEEVENILKGADDEIRKREQDLIKELTSKNFISSLNDIKAQIDDVREIARSTGDFRSYAQLTNTTLHSIEMLINITENFRKRQTTDHKVAIQNNYFMLTLLQKDGIISITDEKKLKSLLGVKDNGELPVIDVG